MIAKGMGLDQILMNLSFLGRPPTQAGAQSSPFADLMKSLLKVSKHAVVQPRIEMAAEDIFAFKTHRPVEQLRKFIQAKGYGLDQLSADNDALDELKNFLVHSGMDQAGLGALIARLKTEAGTKGIKLSELFGDLTEFQETESNDASTTMLEISASPFLESILIRLGLDPGQADKAVAASRIEGEGIDLETLISTLKQLARPLSVENTVLREERGEPRLGKLLAGLGISSEGKEGAALTFDQFVAELQQMAARKGEETASRQILTGDMSRFMQHLRRMEDTDRAEAETDVRLQLPKHAVLNSADKPISSSGRNPGDFLENGAAFKSNQHVQAAGQEAPVVNRLETENLKSADDPSFKSMFASDLGLRPKATGHKGVEAGPAPAARTIPEYMLQQVGRQLVKSLQNRENEIRIQLKPPSLGRLHMRIETGGDGIKVSILTEHHNTREMLLTHAAELKSVLVEQGLRLERMDVQFTFDFDQSMADARQHSGTHHGQGRSAPFMRGGQQKMASVQAEPESTQQQDGVLDLVA